MVTASKYSSFIQLSVTPQTSGVTYTNHEKGKVSQVTVAMNNT